MQRAVGLFDAADLIEKIHVPGAAAKLAVCDTLEAKLGLHDDGVADTFILGLAQPSGRDPTALVLGARGKQGCRPQQAPDMLRPERRLRPCIAHDCVAHDTALRQPNNTIARYSALPLENGGTL